MSEVNALADRLFDTILDRYPLDASLMGFDLDHASLVDHSEDAERQYATRLQAIAQAAQRLQPADLSERLTLGIVLHEVRTQSSQIDARQIEFGISGNLRGVLPGTLAFLPRVPVATEEQKAGYLQRLRGLEGFFATMIERHRAGFANGLTPVKHLVEQAIELMDGHLENLDAFDVLDGAREMIDAHVKPAIENYRAFLRNEALPLGRDTEHPGLCWLPGGDEVYRVAVREHTTEDLDPEELHATGLRLIEDLKREFAQYGDDVFDRIRNDVGFRHSSGEEMLEAARTAVAKAEAVAPRWFRTMPDQKCAIEEAPPSVPAHVPPHYFGASEDGSRPGTYFVNTKEPQNRLKIEDEATAYHEAVPGHHFEYSKAALLKDLPVVRRKSPISVFGEGWALYCERLADEMGLYSSDESRLGMLTMDAMRAGRLVVDTGLHAKGWSRQQAVDFLVENTPMALMQIESEVDRYLGEPGQALAYMVGRLKFQELRRKAEAQGRDVRDFHEVVLSQGRLTLALLDEVVDAWLADA
ncbi:hypothetical protein UK23_12115 [Lentzea aerocolonigenes]|uniref:DUF885 domain-containing protein n=1 Tax=Lentzea aerocolonigenes TaxID=68170 RepID=A0A0F0H8N7_LENAE|nr:DUF885 domain-containing protein [Lentzea aerocolonigenes]KJK49963.1 hypothetical protein UK23_12115 [Lentzea aerocolonigenes]